MGAKVWKRNESTEGPASRAAAPEVINKHEKVYIPPKVSIPAAAAGPGSNLLKAAVPSPKPIKAASSHGHASAAAAAHAASSSSLSDSPHTHHGHHHARPVKRRHETTGTAGTSGGPSQVAPSPAEAPPQVKKSKSLQIPRGAGVMHGATYCPQRCGVMHGATYSPTV